MLKLIFWGIVGYLVYRFFQMKERLKEGGQNGAADNKHQDQQQGSPTAQMKNDGEFIDYEELK